MGSDRQTGGQSVHGSRELSPANGYNYNYDANDDTSDNERKDNAKAQNDENEVA
eukprot:CAMPEP_0171325536 /NCGR_PEP_ID=MMETSP0816-20121228/116869_1 /TAXON_ID=420281 /ORGANISM="Proboscia inermis, Strain CCAP1064/1" /LENGTH=53 /DNA_ID=CAMNT_0011824733 /DNA_START=890 /DNA_END=1047 /DNA_ORIENTATION=+